MRQKQDLKWYFSVCSEVCLLFLLGNQGVNPIRFDLKAASPNLDSILHYDTLVR